jgi:peptidoglycan/xylan/chitin deacetylase (PgdA/CDA1 family)
MHDVPLNEYEENFLKGEVVTNKLMAKYNKKARYFRHPYLRTGESLETKKDFDKFLTAHGYTIAPVTIENSDWYFANLYRRAKTKSDSATMQLAAESYLQFTKDIIEYGEMLSQELFGRQIKHVFLIHANELNADYLDDVVKVIESYGYQFTTLEDALTDEAYKLPDNFIGKYGPVWTQRWALDKGLKDILIKEPDIPLNIRELYEKY